MLQANELAKPFGACGIQLLQATEIKKQMVLGRLCGELSERPLQWQIVDKRPLSDEADFCRLWIVREVIKVRSSACRFHRCLCMLSLTLSPLKERYSQSMACK